MPIKKRKNRNGTTTWILDPYKAQVSALLGDDFDYSTVSPEGLAKLEEEFRKIDEEADSPANPSAGGQSGSA